MPKQVLYILTLCLLLTSCVNHSHNGANRLRADSLYTELSATCYSNIATFDSLATELHSVAKDDNELQMVANNAMAYSAMMQMDYARSVELYRFVRDNSACEIERLVADVGLMTICYRVSANRLFFDYRSTALSRIKRINEGKYIDIDTDVSCLFIKVTALRLHTLKFIVDFSEFITLIITDFLNLSNKLFFSFDFF